MLGRLADRIDSAKEQMILARIQAARAKSPRLRREYRQIERHWREVASTLELAREVSSQLEWRAQRLPPAA